MSELLKLMKERYHKGYLTYHRKFWKEILNHTEDLERKLEEAREAIKEHKKRKKSWGFEGSDYDKVLWEQLKEQG